MKKYVLLIIALLAITPFAMADKKKKGKAGKNETAQVDDSTEIHWMSLAEVEAAMKKDPKKVYMDVYTDWCGWCKVMEKKTFSNTNVIKYMNRHFYPVRLNAEQKDSIHFLGKSYGFAPEYRANTFAVELLQGRMSYPTSVILEENFQNPVPVPGYLDVTMMEKILKYLGENIYKSKQFPEFEKEFVGNWAKEK